MILKPDQNESFNKKLKKSKTSSDYGLSKSQINFYLFNRAKNISID